MELILIEEPDIEGMMLRCLKSRNLVDCSQCGCKCDLKEMNEQEETE